MLGELNPDQIEKLLHGQMIGRIGCSANGITYVVPVTYAYDGKHIYAHSKDGMKIQMMRMNPMICFEVDQMEDMANWQSVIVWGTYEELKNHDQEFGLKQLTSRFQPHTISETSMPSHEIPESHQNDSGPYKTVVFRIEIKVKTGRFEKR